jgi:hypothetical protein
MALTKQEKKWVRKMCARRDEDFLERVADMDDETVLKEVDTWKVDKLAEIQVAIDEMVVQEEGAAAAIARYEAEKEKYK